MRGATGSGARIRQLNVAAVSAATALLHRTRTLPKGTLGSSVLSSWSVSILSELLQDVRKSYEGSRLVGKDGGVLNAQAREAHERIKAEIEKMRLEDALASDPLTKPEPLETAPAMPRKSGRTKGSGSFARVDAPLIAEMREMIVAGQAQSPNAAALKIASRATGGGKP